MSFRPAFAARRNGIIDAQLLLHKDESNERASCGIGGHLCRRLVGTLIDGTEVVRRVAVFRFVQKVGREAMG